METTLSIRETIPLPEEIEKVVISGDLSPLTIEQRLTYYHAKCKSLGLNPLTSPFEYIRLNGKLTLYAKKDASEQLRKIHGVSLEIISREKHDDLYLVHVRAKDKDGRTDEDVGFAKVTNLKGDDLGNAILKAITKAKRRATLSICGLGILDETELDTIPSHALSSPPVGHGDLLPGPEEFPQDPAEVHPTADQVSSLVELARSCGVDLMTLGHDVRTVMGLPEDTKITRKLMRDLMNLTQYEALWTQYSAILKRQVEEDVADFPPPGEATSVVDSSPSAAGEPTGTVDGDAGSDAPDAGEMRELMEYADTHGLRPLFDDNMKRWPDGMSRSAYDRLKANMEWRVREQARQRQAEEPAGVHA